jgi:hypothetical protein
MADHDHLQLVRVQRPPSKRRKVGSAYRPSRRYGNFSGHASDLDTEAADSVSSFEERRDEVADIDPKLILRFNINRRVSEDEWRRSGLTVLDSGDQDAVIVFADEENLDLFRERLAAYSEGPGEPQQRADGKGLTDPTAHFETFFDAIDGLRFTQPEDRLSGRLEAALSEAPDEARLVDVEYWFHSDEGTLAGWMEEAGGRAQARGGELIDEYVNASSNIALARFEGDSDVIGALAELDQVAAIDLVPAPVLERSEFFDLQNVEGLEVNEPEGDAPVVGLIDSGVLSGHPILEPAVVDAVAIHPEFGGVGEDGSGHGSMVAGIYLYGDVLTAARAGEFQADFWLASVRVLDEDARVPVSVNWVKAISEAVVYLAESWQTRVINISIGDCEAPFGGGKSTPLAAELDTLARRYRLIFVISAGNLDETEIEHERWPAYLLEGTGALLDPGQASAAITVGAISSSDGLTPADVGSTLEATAVARSAGPAPFTRIGPGVRGAIKPELNANGGNCRLDHNSGELRTDAAIEVVSASARFPERLYDTAVGTSFAAPAVANVAGRLLARYPGYSANAIRALMLQGAAHLPATEAHFEGIANAETALHSLCGYGGLDWERCGYSDNNRVVMVAEDELLPEDFHVFRIPMTDSFTGISGNHLITVGLAFTPPVRHRRFDYLAFQMDFQLVRGIELDEVFDLASDDFDTGEGESLSQFERTMRPTRTARSRGANQMARHPSSTRPIEKFHDDWYLVIKSFNKWMPKDADPQPYGLAVCVEAERATELYVELEAELTAELEAQA